MASLDFWKMHGIGNDYIVIDNTGQNIKEDTKSTLAKRLCRRRYGIGADGLLLAEPAKAAAIRMRMYNPDGSEAEMCGNGIRCLATYVYETGLVTSGEFEVQTGAGSKTVVLTRRNGVVSSVDVDMGAPVIRALEESLDIPYAPAPFSDIDMGNPHAVFFVDELHDDLVCGLGPRIERHERFAPHRTNVEFAVIRSRRDIDLRVWERGAGETLACGTGACAAVVAGVERGLLDTLVIVHLPGGDLSVSYVDSSVHLTGPAETAYIGSVEI